MQINQRNLNAIHRKVSLRGESLRQPKSIMDVFSGQIASVVLVASKITELKLYAYLLT